MDNRNNPGNDDLPQSLVDQLERLLGEKLTPQQPQVQDDQYRTGVPEVDMKLDQLNAETPASVLQEQRALIEQIGATEWFAMHVATGLVMLALMPAPETFEHLLRVEYAAGVQYAKNGKDDLAMKDFTPVAPEATAVITELDNKQWFKSQSKLCCLVLLQNDFDQLTFANLLGNFAMYGYWVQTYGTGPDGRELH